MVNPTVNPTGGEKLRKRRKSVTAGGDSWKGMGGILPGLVKALFFFFGGDLRNEIIGGGSGC